MHDIQAHLSLGLLILTLGILNLLVFDLWRGHVGIDSYHLLAADLVS